METNTRLLTDEELRIALGDMMIRQPEPKIRFRHVFFTLFATGLFCGLMIADPLARLMEVAR